MPRRGCFLPASLPPFICLLTLPSLRNLPWLPVTPRIVSLGLDLGPSMVPATAPPPPPRPSSSHLPAFSLHAFCSEGQMTADVSGHALLPCLGFCWVCPCLPEALSLPPWLPIPRSPRPSCLTPHLQGVILDPQLLPLSTLWLFILQLPASGDLSVLAFVSSIRLRPQRARRWGSHWTVWPNLGLAQMGSCLAFQFLRYVPACLGLSGSLSTSCELAGPGLW